MGLVQNTIIYTNSVIIFVLFAQTVRETAVNKLFSFARHNGNLDLESQVNFLLRDVIVIAVCRQS